MAVEQVLGQANPLGPDEHGCYVIDLDDGGSAEVFTNQLAAGCMVALRGMTPRLNQFLFDLLKAGNWVMLPMMEDVVAITTSPESVKVIPDDFPEVVVCHSAEELSFLLGNGVETWKNYRDQVVCSPG